MAPVPCNNSELRKMRCFCQFHWYSAEHSTLSHTHTEATGRIIRQSLSAANCTCEFSRVIPMTQFRMDSIRLGPVSANRNKTSCRHGLMVNDNLVQSKGRHVGHSYKSVDTVYWVPMSNVAWFPLVL